MSPQNHALFQIANKALIFKGDLLLTLTTPDGYTDFPGGRVDETEVDLPWTVALHRELDEEIGKTIQVSVGSVAFASKRAYHFDGKHHRIATIFYTCTYEAGDIAISDEHTAFSWINPAELFVGRHKFVSKDEKTCLQQYFQNK